MLRGICGKTLGTWLKLVVLTLTVAAVTALPGDLGLASAASSTVDGRIVLLLNVDDRT